MPRLRILDYFIFLIALSVVILSVFWSASGKEGELRAEIEASGIRYLLPLSQDGQLDLQGPVGDTRVEVLDGEVFISHSDCRDKICISMGHVSTPSGWLACLPNRVFIKVIAVNPDGSAGTEVDSGAF